MTSLIINVRWKKAATSKDMTELLKECRKNGWRVETALGLWTIFARPIGETHDRSTRTYMGRA